jgi:Ser/Thr protein kinase RdoA (MazF antagonist)
MEHAFDAYQKWREPLKELDTLVYLEEDTDGKAQILKFYKQNKHSFINKIKQLQQFLAFLQSEKQILAPQYLVEQIELRQHENEPRYYVPLTYIKGKSLKKYLIISAAMIGEKVAKLHNAAQDFDKKVRTHQINQMLVSKIRNLILQNAELNAKQKKKLKKKCLALQNTMTLLGNEKEHYGLIHSDLHINNWVFGKEEAHPIDFDELAYGHFLTDIAIVLHDFGTDKPKLNDKFLLHYQSIRPLPDNYDVLMLDFQCIAPLLYLNWFYAKDNELVRADEKIKNVAMKNLTFLIE